ncbi:ribosomal subunit 39S-domain-containing protein [Trichophaea hybrida]|nr:ribosomal subunit 39S-domain-containing protein [Trichophaea hybrida]
MKMRRAIPRLRSLRSSPPIIHIPRNPSVFVSTRTFASERLPIQERIRRRLWGSDRPPGPEDPYSRRVAPVEKVAEDEVDRSNYVEAIDARGLPILGLDEPSGTWEVDSFIPDTIVRETEAVHRALHRAVVETFTLHLNGRNAAEELAIDTPVPADLTEGVNISVADNGEARFEYPAATVEAEILKSLEPPPEGERVVGQVKEEKSNVKTEVIEEEINVTREEAVSKATEEPRPTWLEESLANAGWVQLPLTNLEIIFAIVKRVFQLTGQKVPDAVTSQAKTVADILTPLVTPPKAKKLWEELAQIDELVTLPNVKLFSSRIRPMDKERVIGRAIARDEVQDHVYEGIDTRDKVWKGHVVYR